MAVLGSLRVRLPLIFLAGIILAGVVTTLIAVRLFRDFAHDQALAQLSQEAHGIAVLYAASVKESYGNTHDRQAPAKTTASALEDATGDRIYYIGPKRLFPGITKQPIEGLQTLPSTGPVVNWISGAALTFTFTPPHKHRRYYGALDPITDNGVTIGGIIAATPVTSVSDRVDSLVKRLAIAGILGLLIAGALSWYLSRRIVRPVLQLSDAVDAVAAGDYAVKVPAKAPGELGHLSARFREMAARLAEVEAMERNFLMSVTHELRTPLTAIRGHVAALLEGVVEDPELRELSLETVQAETQRLERLVGDILDLAKLDTHRFTVTTEEVDMAQLIDQAYDRYREEAHRRSIDYRQEMSARPVIVSDGDRVLQVVG